MGTGVGSSFDRLVRAKAANLVGQPGSRGAGIGLSIAGFTNMGVGVLLALIGSNLFSPGQLVNGALVASGFVQILAGSVMAHFGLRYLRRSKDQPFEPRLSMEGKMLLINLANHVGWSVWQAPQHIQRCGTVSSAQLAGSRTASQVLPADIYESLEALSQAVNRVSGMLELNPTNQGVRERVPLIRVALDEAVIMSLNEAAVAMTRPEGRAMALASIRRRTTEVEEVAQRLESVLSTEPTLVERLEASSLMSNVVEQLRMDAAARLELHSESAPRDSES